MRLLVNIFKRERHVMLLKQLDYIERLGKNRNQIQPLDLRLGQPFISRDYKAIVKKPALIISDKSYISSGVIT
jgi:hypothetical protein